MFFFNIVQNNLHQNITIFIKVILPYTLLYLKFSRSFIAAKYFGQKKKKKKERKKKKEKKRKLI